MPPYTARASERPATVGSDFNGLVRCVHLINTRLARNGLCSQFGLIQVD